MMLHCFCLFYDVCKSKEKQWVGEVNRLFSIITEPLLEAIVRSFQRFYVTLPPSLEHFIPILV